MYHDSQYNPSYSDMYPGIEISKEVREVLEKTGRKMRYMEVELKRERFRQDQTGMTIEFIPSREDSVERMQDEDHIEFQSDGLLPEESVIHDEILEELYDALERLSPSEIELVKALFFEGVTERVYASKIGISQVGVHKRWQKIREKLKKFLKN